MRGTSSSAEMRGGDDGTTTDDTDSFYSYHGGFARCMVRNLVIRKAKVVSGETLTAVHS